VITSTYLPSKRWRSSVAAAGSAYRSTILFLAESMRSSSVEPSAVAQTVVPSLVTWSMPGSETVAARVRLVGAAGTLSVLVVPCRR
jgi:hypothetical protein